MGADRCSNLPIKLTVPILITRTSLSGEHGVDRRASEAKPFPYLIDARGGGAGAPEREADEEEEEEDEDEKSLRDPIETSVRVANAASILCG